MADFQDLLYKWYEENRRNLPWRETNDPYKIWVSEIILQQTRVAQGMGYYLEFIGRFPDLNSLALADEHDVLKAWQGLGYYSRARNMHEAAKAIVNDFSGIFPADYHDIARLKGIGPYTAAAISSIAFGKAFPVVDGNVFRFLSRFYGIDIPIDNTKGKKYFYELAANLIDQARPGHFNQAVMEFGALQCIPGNPDCTNCLLNDSCSAFNTERVMLLPVKDKRVRQRNRYFHYFLLENDLSVFLQKRKDNDIWKNLYQLPLIETTGDIKPEKMLQSTECIELVGTGQLTVISISPEIRHVLSHQVILARFYHLLVPDDFILSGEYQEVLKKDIHKFAVPRLIETYLSGIGFLNRGN